MPVFWNCHDLAIRLSYLIVKPSIRVCTKLNMLMQSLECACRKELDWVGLASKTGQVGWGACALGGLIAVPPLAAVGAGVFFAAFCTDAVGCVIHEMKMGTKRNLMRQLEEVFPELEQLHSEC